MLRSEQGRFPVGAFITLAVAEQGEDARGIDQSFGRERQTASDR